MQSVRVEEIQRNSLVAEGALICFPAWFDLHQDKAIVGHPTALRVYATLMTDPLIFAQPRKVKAWAVARKLGVGRASVIAAFNLLVERGYVIDHARSDNNVRQVTVALVRAVDEPRVK